MAQMDEDTEHLWKDLCIVCLSACLHMRGVTRRILDPLVGVTGSFEPLWVGAGSGT